TDGSRQELQLKGAGKTPYSRTADGRAVLRSSLREFMCSEAMFHLGVPTTRALSLVGTGEEVIRDMFYDGHPRAEPGAIACRVAPSFMRFGNFQILAANNELEALKRLADYVIRYHYPGHSYASWYQELCRRTAALMVDWMCLGFVHGVMNTDNLSILGLTIDYGPYGWLEGYGPMWTPNTTDLPGRRYCYGSQPGIEQWNLARLAEALLRRYVARARAEGPDRTSRMARVNPKYIFRNYLAQQAIDGLEAGDSGRLERLLGVLARPYDEQPESEEFAARRPEWARSKPGCSALSCSS